MAFLGGALHIKSCMIMGLKKQPSTEGEWGSEYRYHYRGIHGNPKP